MAKPIANFGYSVNLNTVAFSDLSIHQPVSWDWDFGDGHTSNDQNPTHTYLDPGTYTVSLKVTNTDPEESSSETYIETILVNENPSIFISTTILELIGHYIPNAIVSETSVTEKINLIRKWQLYLQPLIYIPIKVSEQDVYNEVKYPGLVKMLIAQLSAYDTILQAANAFIAMASSIKMGSGENESGGEPTPIDELKQQIKSIETGPAKTEWFENKSYLEDSEAFENMANAFSSATKAGGALDQLRVSICQLAARIRISLPMCDALPFSQVPPQVTGKKRSGHNANPFGITKRML